MGLSLFLRRYQQAFSRACYSRNFLLVPDRSLLAMTVHRGLSSSSSSARQTSQRAGKEKSPKPFNDWPNEQGVRKPPVYIYINEFSDINCCSSPPPIVSIHRLSSRSRATFLVGPLASSTAQRPGAAKSIQIKAGSSRSTIGLIPFRSSIISRSWKDEHGSVRVFYNSRSTCDELIEKIRKNGRWDDISFGAKYDPCTSYFKKVMSIFHSYRAGGIQGKPDGYTMAITLSANFPGLSKTGEKQHHGHASGIQTLCNKTDANGFQMLDPETLEPIGLASQTVLHPGLKGPFSSAHAKSDPLSGDVFNYNLEPGLKSTYRIFRVSASTGKTSILASFTADAAYLHSFFLSKNYVILCVWNSFYTAHGASVLLNRNIVDSIADYFRLALPAGT